jgi:hypothetical protein
MIMVVIAAPISVPATPIDEVTPAAPADAAPAATTWDGLTIGSADLLMTLNLPADPAYFKDKTTASVILPRSADGGGTIHCHRLATGEPTARERKP